MNTGPFLDISNTSKTIIMLFPLVITLFAYMGDWIIGIVEEENEAKIQEMLKLMGMRGKVEVC